MTTYSTGNPIGSTAPKDLYDNSENLDVAVNDTTTDTWVDRLGVTRKSWEGIEAEAEARVTAAVIAAGYQYIETPYAAGIEVTEYNQLIEADGEFWKLDPATPLPYTTDGTGMPEGGAFVPVGDASLRQELNAPLDSGYGGFVVSGVALRASTVAEMELIPTEYIPDGGSIVVAGYHSPGDGMGGVFSWDSAREGENDGGTVFSGWVRQFSGDAKVSYFGIAEGESAQSILVGYDAPIDGDGKSYTFSYATRTSSLYNINITKSDSILPPTHANGALVFTSTEGMNARKIKITYTGSTPGVRGVVVKNADSIDLRESGFFGFTEQGCRIEGSDDADLTGCSFYDCMKDAIGSLDPGQAYGAIAVFGGTDVSNRCRLIGISGKTQSSGISVSHGDGHIIQDCNIDVISVADRSPVSMGIYCLGKITNLNILYNTVGSFANEGIDIHNTGGSPEVGIRGIRIIGNTVVSASYAGVSVVSDPAQPIADALILGNDVLNESAGDTFGFSHGYLLEGVESVILSNNIARSQGQTPTESSYAYQIFDCDNVEISGWRITGPWDIICAVHRYERLSINGGGKVMVPADKVGLQLLSDRADAVHQLTSIRIATRNSNSIAIKQVGSSIPLSNFVMTGCVINGQVQITDAESGQIAGNRFLDFAGTIASSATFFIGGGQGSFLPFEGGTTKANPQIVDRWERVKIGGTNYYRPLYASKT